MNGLRIVCTKSFSIRYPNKKRLSRTFETASYLFNDIWPLHLQTKVHLSYIALDFQDQYIKHFIYINDFKNFVFVYPKFASLQNSDPLAWQRI